ATLNASNIGCLRVDLNRNGVIENPIPATDPNPALRGKFESNVDLNADGDCFDVVAGAREQRAFRTNVYAIGFGGACPTATIESIATGGGIPLHSVACTGSQQHGYYAQNEADVSAAINEIIAGSALREVCNGADDNCNGVVDEGYALGVACSAGVGAC